MIAVCIIAVLFSRFVTIFGFGALSNQLANSQISLPEQTVLWWGGLRGSVSVALALSVPAALSQRQEIIDTVFGVVLFTLLVQGLTMQWMLEKFNLIGEQRLTKDYSQLLARQSALKRVIDYLDQLILARDRNLELCESKKELVQKQLLLIEAEIVQQQIKYPQLDSLMIEKLEENLLNIESDTYAELIRSGRLDNDLTPLLEEVFAIKKT